MKVDNFFFRLYAIDRQGKTRFIGSAFPVNSTGALLTCRHVAEVPEGSTLLVHDNHTGKRHEITEVVYSPRALDLAFLPNALPGPDRPFLPFLTPTMLRVGEDVYSFGSFVLAGPLGDIEQGYFAGKIVNFTKTSDAIPIWSITLPYPLIEGLSGSAVLAYHHGPKVVGLGYRNRSTRILASEVVEVRDGSETFRETVNRIVEFGLAYHGNELVKFLQEVGATGYTVTADTVGIPGLQ